MSFEFFKSLFEEKISSFDPERPTWKGLRVYGCDGDQYEIPLSNDILDQGYRGYPCKNNKETYFPRMYVVHAYDVLSRVSKDIRYSPTNDEVHNSFEMASVFEKESVTLYDRLLFSKDMIRTHGMVGSYFVAKCKCGSTFNEVIEFFESKCLFWLIPAVDSGSWRPPILFIPAVDSGSWRPPNIVRFRPLSNMINI